MNKSRPVLVIDNYDSFVHNLARYIRLVGYQTEVVRNDKINSSEITKLDPLAIVISPGPCTPDEAGISLEVVAKFGSSKPILGICLGHQTIIQSFGGNIVRAVEPVHGRATAIQHNQQGVFQDLPVPLNVGRYHSLVGESEHVPDCLDVTAKTSEGTIMAVQHRSHPVVGLQFHPESVLTEDGLKMLQNFFEVSDDS